MDSKYSQDEINNFLHLIEENRSYLTFNEFLEIRSKRNEIPEVNNFIKSITGRDYLNMFYYNVIEEDKKEKSNIEKFKFLSKYISRYPEMFLVSEINRMDLLEGKVYGIVILSSLSLLFLNSVILKRTSLKLSQGRRIKNFMINLLIGISFTAEQMRRKYNVIDYLIERSWDDEIDSIYNKYSGEENLKKLQIREIQDLIVERNQKI